MHSSQSHPAAQYVIFDEVHSIGTEDGAVWERLIQMVDAPFLALSATVGGPESFQSWLQRVSAGRRQVELVVESKRWVEPQMYLYAPSCPAEELGVDPSNLLNPTRLLPEQRNREAAELVPLHTLACCSIDDFVWLFDRGQLSLTSRETLELFHAMSKAAAVDPGLQQRVAALHPASYPPFRGTRELTRADSKAYAAALLQELRLWTDQGTASAEALSDVLRALRAPVLEGQARSEGMAGSDSRHFVKKHMTNLVLTLKVTDH